jgi:hypothetical protein
MAEPRVGIAMPVVRRFHLMAIAKDWRNRPYW